ncbi:hypothetical protein TNCV_4476581 [Trichonephila clavipes]|nr:hypothetical protein TNCV_4476581 [Trichonephila clavipes]
MSVHFGIASTPFHPFDNEKIYPIRYSWMCSTSSSSTQAQLLAVSTSSSISTPELLSSQPTYSCTCTDAPSKNMVTPSWNSSSSSIILTLLLAIKACVRYSTTLILIPHT